MLVALIVQQAILQRNIIQNASAISTTTELGIYWDANCTKEVTSINWGTLSPGDSRSIALYILNKGNENITLLITTTNWDPPHASQFLTLSCKPNKTTIEPQKPVKITLTLQVKQDIEDIKAFSFDILFEGTDEFLPTDLNKDGIVNLMDFMIVAIAYGSKPGDANWNEIADINKDERVDLYDVILISKDYGKTS